MAHALQPITVDEFVRLVPEGEKADLLDGVIVMASPDSPRSAKVNGFLGFLLLGYARTKQLGEVFGPRSAFALSDIYAPEPDIAFVRAGRDHLWRGSCFQGPPDIAVEIVAPDSVERDTETKRLVYERACVPEYWIVDLVEDRCRFLALEQARYKAVELEGGCNFRSQALHGFWLDTRWLLQAELPDPLECLHGVLRA